MNRKILTLLALAVAALAVLTFGLDSTPVDASSNCSDCEGPVRTAYGQGSGNSCGEALDNAEADAFQNAAGTPSGCIPCQTSSGISNCAVPGCAGSCPPNSYQATTTLHYKCQFCNFDPEIPPM